MKNRIFPLYFLFVFAIPFLSMVGCKKDKVSSLQPFYYYGRGEKIYLTPVPTKLMVRFINEAPDSLKAWVSRLDGVNSQVWVDSLTVIISTVDSKTQENLLHKYRDDDHVVSAYPMYTTSAGGEVGMTDEFSVQFLDNVSLSRIEQLNNTYHVTIIKKTDFDYLLRVAPKENTLKIANKYYETGLTKFSEPNFWQQIFLF